MMKTRKVSGASGRAKAIYSGRISAGDVVLKLADEIPENFGIKTY